MLNVSVVSPDRTVFQGEAASVVAPAWDGQVGLRSRHAPMITLLGSGPLTVDNPGGGSHEFWIAGGVLKVESDVVTILTEFASDSEPDQETRERLAAVVAAGVNDAIGV